MAKNTSQMNSLEGLFGSAIEYGESTGMLLPYLAGKLCKMTLSKLHTFKNHPYLVKDDESMIELAESIREHGQLEPLLIRPHPDIQGEYEVVVGHRRRRACEINEMDEVLVIIREMDDKTAINIMVDSNNKRPNLLPSEKAKAYRMKYEVAKKQGKRTDLSDSGERYCVENNLGLGNVAKESKRQINRYVRLSYLIDPLLNLVDDKKIAFNIGVDLAYLSIEEQQIVFTYGLENKKYPSLEQANKIKELSKQGTKITTNLLDAILNPNKEREVKVVLKNKQLQEYFPSGTTEKEMEEVILELLKEWRMKQGSGNSENAEMEENE